MQTYRSVSEMASHKVGGAEEQMILPWRAESCSGRGWEGWWAGRTLAEQGDEVGGASGQGEACGLDQ